MILKFIKKHSWILTAFLAIVLIPQSLTVQSKLEGRLIITGLAIDKQDDKYIITAQAVSPSSGYISGKDSAGIDFVTVSANSIRDGITEIATTTSKVPGMGHLNFLLLGKSLFSEDISSVIDFVVRDSHSDTSVLLLVANNANEEIRKTKEIELGSAIQLRKLFLSKHKMCNGVMTTANQFISNKYNPSHSGVINYLKINLETQNNNYSNNEANGASGLNLGLVSNEQQNNQTTSEAIKQGRIEYTTPIALFANGFYKGELASEKEILGYNMLCCKSKNFIYGYADVNMQNGDTANITMQSKNKKSSLSIEIENGTPKIKIKAKLENNQILEIAPKINSLENYKTQGGYLSVSVKKSIEKQLADAAVAAFESARNQGVDILNACNFLYRHHKKQYDNYFKAHTVEDFLKSAEFCFEIKIGNSTK